jgi:hypothetical protein
MNIFPSKELSFKLKGDYSESLDRLNRRTDKSENLTSQYTDKSFRGAINGNQFQLISSTIGKGAFCVMTGELSANVGNVKVEIHKAFKILLSIILFLPIVAVFVNFLTNRAEWSPILILVAIGQILMIRFILIGLAFRFLSTTSLNKLRDVLDFEWTSQAE